MLNIADEPLQDKVKLEGQSKGGVLSIFSPDAEAQVQDRLSRMFIGLDCHCKRCIQAFWMMVR